MDVVDVRTNDAVVVSRLDFRDRDLHLPIDNGEA